MLISSIKKVRLFRQYGLSGRASVLLFLAVWVVVIFVEEELSGHEVLLSSILVFTSIFFAWIVMDHAIRDVIGDRRLLGNIIAGFLTSYCGAAMAFGVMYSAIWQHDHRVFNDGVQNPWDLFYFSVITI